jgi:hypothetical protein
VARNDAQRARAGLPNGEMATGPDVIAKLADDVLPTLVARLERSRLGEIEVRQMVGGPPAAQPGHRRPTRRFYPAADELTESDRAAADRSADWPLTAGLSCCIRSTAAQSRLARRAPATSAAREGAGVGTNARRRRHGHVDVLACAMKWSRRGRL